MTINEITNQKHIQKKGKLKSILHSHIEYDANKCNLIPNAFRKNNIIVDGLRMDVSIKVKLEVSYHKLDGEQWSNAKPLVFVMDNPPQAKDEVKKEKKKKGSKTPLVTAKNFGAWMNVSKFKTAGDTMKLAWRCRFSGIFFMIFNF